MARGAARQEWQIPRSSARRSAANSVFGILKSALNMAWCNHRVTSDQAWRCVKSFKGVTASRARYLQLDECRRLLNAGDDFRDIIEAGLHSIARWSELCRLKLRDVNGDAGTIAVHLSKSRKARHIILNEDGVHFFARAVARAQNRDSCLSEPTASRGCRPNPQKRRAVDPPRPLERAVETPPAVP